MLRPTVNRPVCLGVKPQTGAQDQTLTGLLMWGALSDERTGVIYNCCWSSPAQSFSGPSSGGLMTIFYCIRLQTPSQPGGPGTRIYIPQEQGSPVTPPGTGFPFRRLLRLAGLRWRYSNPPPCGVTLL
jgi:hypothetical protein